MTTYPNYNMSIVCFGYVYTILLCCFTQMVRNYQMKTQRATAQPALLKKGMENFIVCSRPICYVARGLKIAACTLCRHVKKAREHDAMRTWIDYFCLVLFRYVH